MAELLVKVEGAEIRGVEEKEGSVNKDTGERRPSFLIVRIDDKAGVRHELLDRDVENKDKYTRGVVCDIDVVLKYGGYGKNTWARLEIKGIRPEKKA